MVNGDVGKTEVVIETKEIPEPKVEVPHEGQLTQQEGKGPAATQNGDEDEIPVGHSPGSPVESSAAPPFSGKSDSKFDNYYHQKLGYKIDSELTAYVSNDGTDPAPLRMPQINFDMRYNQRLGHQVLQTFFMISGIIANFLMICYDIRIRTRCDPKVTKKITASKEMLQLYSTPDGRLLSYIYICLWLYLPGSSCMMFSQYP